MQGILLVDKPKDWTSFDVVNYVRKIVAQEEGKKPKNCKVGHTGTLDPAATGLLVLLVGKDYTRKAQELTKLDKTYEVTMKLGEVSTTGDSEGDITPYVHEDELTGVKMPSQDEACAIVQSFVGEIMQVPPAYSAIKINGQKAYDLARKGQEVVLESRSVIISAIHDITYNVPYITFTCDVSSGTYIRSLVQDIGLSLETGAYMSGLRRTRVGKYDISNSLEVTQLTPKMITESLRT
ncbi:MAG: tRNA pseudouridine55 synthase [Patescibacteria group bacterium]|nr:tRNA pseudouridine(55) synthase TruB [Candidatus Saccharibacteria bacterium]MDQ5963390.1 tRNA pseudouridine55 synthase [Patescibacteria group bacterium]